jgi:hypothetical protein
VNAAEDDRLGIRFGGLLLESERVADVVGNVLDLGQLVIVGEDHRTALGGERPHLFLEEGDVL